MALSEGQFKDLEKRLLAFKAQFGITHTAQSLISAEKFGKSYNIYPDDILTETDNIPFNLDFEGASDTDGNNVISPARTRTWVPSSDSSITDIREKIIRGNFETTFDPDSPNTNVELVIIPLTKVKGTGGQIYTAFGKESISDSDFDTDYSSVSSDSKGSYTEFKYDNHAEVQSQILTNFINPAKFGGSYTAQIFSSNVNVASASATSCFTMFAFTEAT